MKLKTVLVVEDEKLIRQGIKTMIMRSGVPVEVIMECNNGETALEILKEHTIDVMFTDIRMPKMDGITLVHEMQALDRIPLVVAISGYDDFNYAVEMMRNGVREYILKPIKREKIKEILEKLDEEISQGQEEQQNSRQLGIAQLKYLMQNDAISETELAAIRKEYQEADWIANYRVCCCNPMNHKIDEENNYLFIPELSQSNIYIVAEDKLDYLLCSELQNGYAGISELHSGIEEMAQAYKEAVNYRKIAFCQNRKNVSAKDADKKIPEGLREEAGKLTLNAACQQRLQLLGTKKTEELTRVWKRFFYEVKHGHLCPEEYEQCMTVFFEDVMKTYQNILVDKEEVLNHLRQYWMLENVDAFEAQFLVFILGLHEDINRRLDVNKNEQKVQEAVAYIEQNYNQDLNMAVVSNYISMNYSLFSFLFKQYTGNNFVNYLKELRMKKAKELLSDTDMRIIDISHEVGYENEKHFMKLFKAACGVSPSEYRKNVQG